MEPSSDTSTLEDLAGKAVAVVSGTLVPPTPKA